MRHDVVSTAAVVLWLDLISFATEPNEWSSALMIIVTSVLWLPVPNVPQIGAVDTRCVE